MFVRFFGRAKNHQKSPPLCAMIFCKNPQLLSRSSRNPFKTTTTPSRTRSALGQKSKMSFRRGLQLPLAIEIHLRGKNTTPSFAGKYVLFVKEHNKPQMSPFVWGYFGMFWDMLSDLFGILLGFNLQATKKKQLRFLILYSFQSRINYTRIAPA